MFRETGLEVNCWWEEAQGGEWRGQVGGRKWTERRRGALGGQLCVCVRFAVDAMEAKHLVEGPHVPGLRALLVRLLRPGNPLPHAPRRVIIAHEAGALLHGQAAARPGHLLF